MKELSTNKYKKLNKNASIGSSRSNNIIKRKKEKQNNIKRVKRGCSGCSRNRV